MLEVRVVVRREVPRKVRFTVDGDVAKSVSLRFAEGTGTELVFALCSNAPVGALELLEVSYTPREDNEDESEDEEDDEEEELLEEEDVEGLNGDAPLEADDDDAGGEAHSESGSASDHASDHASDSDS